MKLKDGELTGYEGQAVPSIPLWLVWAVALSFVLIGLGSFGILDNNEGLYAEIPREMLASRDWRLWIIPHLNGLPYMEKPPLLYWLTALSFALFGEAEWSARMVPALSSLSCVALLLWFSKTVNRVQEGRLAALMFVSGMGVMAMSHVLMFDMLLTVLLTAALMFAYHYMSGASVSSLRWSYAFLALAVLAKGFVALILFGLVVVAFMLSDRPSFRECMCNYAKWFEPHALLVFFAIAAPWHIAASMTEPLFAWFYFINEHVLRFLGKREPHDYYSGGWWYYLPRMAIYLFPWSFLLFGLFTKGQAEKTRDGLTRFLLIAWLAPLVFFSISSAKANYYLVAVMPFAALHFAVAIERHGFLRPWVRALPSILIALLGLALYIAVSMRPDDAEHSLFIMGMRQQQFSLYFLTGMVLLSLIVALAAWRFARIGILAYLALPVWIVVGLVVILQAMEPLVSTRQLAQYLQQELPGRTVYLYRNYEEQSSLPFYLKHAVPVVDARSNDLYWGNKLRSNEMIISNEQFYAQISSKPVVIVVMQRQLKDFKDAVFFKRLTEAKRIGETMIFIN